MRLAQCGRIAKEFPQHPARSGPLFFFVGSRCQAKLDNSPTTDLVKTPFSADRGMIFSMLSNSGQQSLPNQDKFKCRTEVTHASKGSYRLFTQSDDRNNFSDRR